MSHASELIESDILGYLKQHENKDLLRFITCGSVDDGKSTLIGRLLYDTKLIFEDHLAALHKDNERVGNAGEALDLALLVDGLQSEREQGITIDVAYRYFSTDKRKFIIADTPGHEQYTRNMATGASTANLAIILIDARRGVLTQTRRHSFIVNLLGIKHVVVAINKMDLVHFDEAEFNRIRDEYLEFAKALHIPDIQFVPMSALNGDNVVNKSDAMPWYQGEPLMQILENVEITKDINFDDFRMPVQFVNRPNLDFRGFCGTVASGIVRKGDSVTALPSGKSSKVKAIVTADGELDEAFPPQAITLVLEDEIDISRGDVIVKTDNLPTVSDTFDADIVWMSEAELEAGKRYWLKTGGKLIPAKVERIDFKTDVNTMAESATRSLALNEIGRCRLVTDEPLALDAYEQNSTTGAFILIDRMSNATLGAGMIASIADAQGEKELDELERLQAFEQELNALVRKYFPHWEAKDISKLR
ncbi:sulfate adenylyltransferase subunit CysN [Pokkaliibacter sp. MBI-7]|uniref:sulfate adenylyltransferase subunit CysN n=1 Tax=Pokkaliibacter sp. MBI-7 TaxID=3040600 RepID=UPI00244951E8|nr:sulfate adenylyltransferase subunit CysN [Pokkaliibacter sp. MBI-7]MDH2436582.1 sulfate adenylyltransferase subunit CysN [Pokkaliibacter sp. MBI-7]